MKTPEAIDAFVTNCRARNLRPKSVSAYVWALAYIRHFEELPTEPYEIEMVLAATAGRLGSESRFDLWRRLRTFFRWLALRHQQPNPFERLDPLVGHAELLIRAPQRLPLLPKLLSSQQIQDLLDMGCGNQRDWLMVMLPMDNGLRLGEVATLKKSDISPDILRVHGKRGTREVPITPEIMYALLSMGDVENVWVSKKTGYPLTWHGVQLAYRRIFKRAGIKAGPNILRHTFATEYLRRGGNVFSLQRILGHRNIKTTEIYVHLVHEDLVNEHRRVSPALPFINR